METGENKALKLGIAASLLAGALAMSGCAMVNDHPFQQCAHPRQNRRIQAIGLLQVARRLSETARLARTDLNEQNARRAKRALDCTMIGPSRFEHDTVFRRVSASRLISALRPPWSLAKRRVATQRSWTVGSRRETAELNFALRPTLPNPCH